MYFKAVGGGGGGGRYLRGVLRSMYELELLNKSNIIFNHINQIS